MNRLYMANWPRLRAIEGASQRVQEDTMRFATTMEGLGVNLIRCRADAAGLPAGSRQAPPSNVTELPLIGLDPLSACVCAVICRCLGPEHWRWIGISCPRNRCFSTSGRAAYRKELVLGEDDPTVPLHRP